MIDTTSLLQSLSATDPMARQGAKQALEAFLQATNTPIVQGIKLAEQVENERQARVVSGVIGRAIDKNSIAELVPLTCDESGWTATIARRAIRTWVDAASPVEAAMGLQLCLLIAAEKNDSRTEEFICTTLLEKVGAEGHLAYRPLISVLEAIMAHRSGLRRNMSWLIGTVSPTSLTPFELTLSTLKSLLPDADLPLPAASPPSAQNLPRPVSEASVEDTDKLPLPAQSMGLETQRSLWDRLFRRRTS